MDGHDNETPQASWRAAHPSQRTKRGRRVESLVAAYVELLGWSIVARNAREGRGEIDLVARDGREIVFVEVRSRRARGRVSPEESIGAAKRRRLIEAASRWIGRHGAGSSLCRFDVVAVELSRAGLMLRHLRGAFVDDQPP